MNQLSWLLYAADVAQGLGGLALFLAIVSGIVSGFCVPLRIAAEADDTVPPQVRDGLTYAVKWAFGIFIAASLVAVLTPEKDTLYAIAASEVGEQIVASPTANKAVQALNHWLDEQIEGDDGPEPSK